MKRIVITVLLFSCLVFPIAIINASQVETTQIPALSTETWTFNLNSGDSFSGSLSISGGSGNDIDCRVTDPQGTIILDLGRVSQGKSFGFTAQQSGAYTIHFGNTFSLLTSKTVAVTYDIEHPFLGGGNLDSLSVPVTVIVAGVIIAVLVIIGLVVVLTRNKTKNDYLPPPPPQS